MLSYQLSDHMFNPKVHKTYLKIPSNLLMFLYSSNLIQFHIKDLFKMPSVCTITAEYAMRRSLASDAYLEARHTRTGPDVTWKRMRWVSTYHMSLFICRRMTIKIKKIYL